MKGTPFMTHHNQKVALNRGEKWRKNLKLGRANVVLNPTVLRAKRAELGCSQASLANQAGIHVNTYCAIEAGKRSVREEKAGLLAKTLKVAKNNAFSNIDGKLFAKSIK